MCDSFEFIVVHLYHEVTKLQAQENYDEPRYFYHFCLCMVSEHLQKLVNRFGPVRRGGFAPALSDAEVLTIEISGEFFKLHTDKAIFDYFRAHYQHFFPALRDRPGFVRQAANWQRWKQALPQHLVRVSGADQDPVQAIDTLPLPVCTYTRARDRCFPTEAGYSHCAAKNLDYYGFKLSLRIARNGMITHYPLLAARPHDVNHLGALGEGFSGLVPRLTKAFLMTISKTFGRPARGRRFSPRRGVT